MQKGSPPPNSLWKLDWPASYYWPFSFKWVPVPHGISDQAHSAVAKKKHQTDFAQKEGGIGYQLEWIRFMMLDGAFSRKLTSPRLAGRQSSEQLNGEVGANGLLTAPSVRMPPVSRHSKPVPKRNHDPGSFPFFSDGKDCF